MKNCNLFAVGVIVGVVAAATLCINDKKTFSPPPPKECCGCAKQKPKCTKLECENCYYQAYYR